MTKYFTADFETTGLYFKVNEKEKIVLDENKNQKNLIPYVWLWGLLPIRDGVDIDNFKYNNSIEKFMMEVFKQEKSIIYFHNLKFDFSYILAYLFRQGYTCVNMGNIKDMPNKSFSVLLTDMGILYSVKIKYNSYIHTELRDSYKLCMCSIAELGKIVGIKKGETPLKKWDNKDCLMSVFSVKDVDYIFKDCLISNIFINSMLKQKYDRITIASNALKRFKELIDIKNYCAYIHCLDSDDEEVIRKSYHGGFTFFNEKFVGEEIYNVEGKDIVSSYPFIMKYLPLPVGKPVFIKDKKPENFKKNKLYIIVGKYSFNLKNNYVPTLLKKNFGQKNEFLKEGYEEILVLTQPDYELFFKHYNIESEEYNFYELDKDIILYGGYYEFNASSNIFKDYIEEFFKKKIEAKNNNDKINEKIAKLFMNSLYGKFATSSQSVNVKYNFDNGKIEKENYISDITTANIAIASFITAYARKRLIDNIQVNYDNFIYADTDSIYAKFNLFLIEDRKNLDDILGSWENVYKEPIKRIKVLGQKCYIVQLKSGKEIYHVSGFKKINFNNLESKEIKELQKLNYYEDINFSNFNYGSKYYKNIQEITLKTGEKVLIPSTFELKQRNKYI